MAISRQEDDASERSPLLGSNTANGYVVDQQQQSEANDDSNEVVLAEPPSTGKLIVILAACFMGVFFAALGTHITPGPQYSLLTLL